MQCSHDTAAFEATAALEAYEDQLRALRRCGARESVIAPLHEALRRVSANCLRLPQLSGPSLALLLAHHRLLADLSHAGGAAARAPSGARLLELEQCMGTLRRACRELFLARHRQ